MARACTNKQVPVAPTDDQISVSLTVEDWQNVLASMEKGIQVIGFNAFEIGGRVMREIQEQVEKGTN